MRSVLLVEDVAAQRDLVRQVLERREWTVTAVGDGRDGISCLQERDFDAILLDLRMPVCSGEFVVEWVLKNRIHLRSRIIIVTGAALSQGLAAFLKHLEIPLLPKPYSLNQLISAVEAIAGRRNEIRSAAG
jgi:CheY-like chemotaxis protein